ncbi:MAG: hypothetical protein LBB85_02175 [Dysgonamonadaceae bacterium]|jgi:hypothetical protein|nr:hypothetical protein [Dysgonamonadaceae bacterium]
MNKQAIYVPPGVEVYRVEMESRVAVPTSVGPVKAQIETWDTNGGNTYIFGDASGNAEGGEIFVNW